MNAPKAQLARKGDLPVNGRRPGPSWPCPRDTKWSRYRRLRRANELKSAEARVPTRRPGATAPRASRGDCLDVRPYFFSIFRRSISFLSASRFMTLNSTRRFFDMLSADVLGTSGRLEP